jgi:hypothetical protein
MIVSNDNGASMAWVHVPVNACDNSVAECINADTLPAITWKRGCRKQRLQPDWKAW